MRDDSPVVRRQPPADQFDLAVEVFRMLSDATRLRLLWALLDDEKAVNGLAEAVGKPAAGVSQHLAKLRMARLVRTRREANKVYYRIENEHVRQLVEDAMYHAEHTSGGLPEHHRSDRQVSEMSPGSQAADSP
jgi:DNA-binding transcriptional ArsR family regulator